MTASRRTSPACRAVVSLLTALAVAACGGGGGSATTPAAPVAGMTVSVSDGYAPLAVTFDAAASQDSDGTITAYHWDFGDTDTAAGASVSHTYTDPGSFTATLRVTDDDGLSASTSRTVRVRGTTIAGVVQIAPGTNVDSDVNDRLTTPISNDTFGTAQVVTDPPLLLGGFANQPGTGSDNGNFHDSGDVDDYFAVHLNGDERIVLSIGDPTADLDLQIYSDEAQPQMLNASVSSDPTEDVPAPGEGDFFVHVLAVSGASSYVLSIARDIGTTALRRRAKRLSDPFVPGEVLVGQQRHGPIRRYGVRRAGAGHGNRLSSLQGFTTPPDVRLPEVSLPPGATMSPAMAARYRTLLAVKHLRSRERMPVAEVNVLRQPMQIPSDTNYFRQWHYRAINLEQAWDITTGESSPPVVVAVVDTGVLLHHPDLDDKLLRDTNGQVVGYDFVQDPTRANDGDGIDPNPDDPGDDELGPGQGSFHGTHVAGTVGAETNNLTGVAGVSWGARVMPVRALGINGGTTYDVMQAVRYAAGLSNDSGTVPPVRADIVNMSLGSDFYSEAEQQTLNDVRAQGVFVVASAGNASSDVPSYPASYDGVISVAATTVNDALASYTNFGPFIDVAAPGGDFVGDGDQDNDGLPDAVLSTLGDSGGGQIQFGYGYLAGTSMAAPHVSGVIALMKSVYPGLAPSEFDRLLMEGRLTRDAGDPGRDDHYGWGIIDAYQSVLAAESASGAQVGPVISVSISTLNFQQFTRELNFSVSNVGDQATTVSVTDDADAGGIDWLSVSQPAPTADGFGQYRATVDRTGLAEGSYTATITAQSPDSQVQPAQIQVLVTVPGADASADAGQQYVVLVGPDQNDSVALDVVTAQNGQYQFVLEDVPPGDYRLFAGTDLNDDDTICDGGEACGAYPNLSSPAIIHVDPAQQPQIDGLSFASEFRTTVITTSAASESATASGGLHLTRSGEDP